MLAGSWPLHDADLLAVLDRGKHLALLDDAIRCRRVLVSICALLRPVAAIVALIVCVLIVDVGLMLS